MEVDQQARPCDDASLATIQRRGDAARSPGRVRHADVREKSHLEGCIMTISEGTIAAGSGSWWTTREKIIVKNTSAIIVPTASPNRLTSYAHAIGMLPPATAMSSVATPEISQEGAACAGSTLPRSRRPAT